MFSQFKLTTRFLVIVGGSTIVLLALIIAFGARQHMKQALTDSREQSLAIAYRYRDAVKSDVETSLDMARALAYAFEGIKHARTPEREVLNSILKNTLMKEKNYLAVWTIWEPDLLDGQDLSHANTPGSNAQGQFLPYWNRFEGVISVDVIKDFARSEYYALPKAIGKEVVTNPYTYPIVGQNAPMMTSVAPIFSDGIFCGGVGVDIALDRFQSIVEQIHPQETGYSAIVANDGTYVAHADPEKILTKIENETILQKIRQGEVYEGELPSSVVGGQVYAVFVPIYFGNTLQPWSLAVYIPVAEIYGQYDKARKEGMALGGLILCGFLMLMYFLARSISRPVVRLSAAAERIAGGALDFHFPSCQGKELIALQNSLEKMRGSLLAKIEESQEQTEEIEALYNQVKASESYILQQYHELQEKEEALNESEKRFRAVISNTPVIIYSFDREGIFTVFEGHGVEKIGMQPGQLIGRSVEDTAPLAEQNRRILRGESVSGISKAGGHFFEYYSEPLHDESGNVVGATGVAVDISERYKAEMERNEALEDLRASEERYRLVANNVYDIIYATDLTGRLTFVTPSVLPLTGYNPEQVMGKIVMEVFSPEFAQPLQAVYDAGVAGDFNELRIEPHSIETVLKHRDGTTFAAELSYSGLVDDTNRTIGVVGVVRNIEERKKMQNDLLEMNQDKARMEQLMSMATMTAGVIHEINQPLNAIKLISSGILLMHQKGRLETVEQYDEDIREISKQADKVHGILDHLKSFSRKEFKQVVPVSVNDAVKQALAFLDTQLTSRGILVEQNLQADLMMVLAVPEAIEEIAVNLLVNAMQALGRNEQSNRRIFVKSWNDDQVFLRISDNGPGISPEVGEKIFEPFVSSKSDEENMGLGLAIVRNMVAGYGGTIVLEQDHTVGASFVVSFPARLQEG